MLLWHVIWSDATMMCYLIWCYYDALFEVMLWRIIWSDVTTTRYLKWYYYDALFNHFKAELNPICHLLALLGAHHFLHVSSIRVNLLLLWRTIWSDALTRHLKCCYYDALFEVMLIRRTIWNGATLMRCLKWRYNDALFDVILLWRLLLTDEIMMRYLKWCYYDAMTLIINRSLH